MQRNAICPRLADNGRRQLQCACGPHGSAHVGRGSAHVGRGGASVRSFSARRERVGKRQGSARSGRQSHPYVSLRSLITLRTKSVAASEHYKPLTPFIRYRTKGTTPLYIAICHLYAFAPNAHYISSLYAVFAHSHQRHKSCVIPLVLICTKGS